MANVYSALDSLTSEEVASFKEDGRAQEMEAQATAFRLFDEDKPDRGVGNVLVAEGDSWFDYAPGTDILDCLRKHHGYAIESLAHAGDTLENMIYGTQISKTFDRVSPTITRVLEKLGRIKPKVFLFSGGGNDIAGDEFESYLNHAMSGLPPLRADVVATVIDVAFRKYFVDLIAKVASVSPDTHVVTHGYGHTTPTGIPVNLFIFTFAGPWMRPALARKGLFDPIVQRDTVNALIDRYNQMLAELDRSFEKFHHVDLRDMLDADSDWANELHLRNSAYARVADRIHATITAL